MGNDLLTGFLAGQSDGNGNKNGGGFFGNEGLWAVIILAMIFGGGNGLGGRNSGNGGGENNVTYIPYPAPGCGMGFGGYPSEAVLQRSLDTQTIIGKLDGVTQGLCDGFYATQGAISGLGTATMQGFSQAELSRCNQQAALMQQLNALGYQQQDCCCETQRAIDNVRFTISQEDCATRNLIQANTRDIIQNAHNDTDRVIAKLDAMEMARKDEIIAALRGENQTLRFQSSQRDQNGFIDAVGNSVVARLQQPQPVPSYQVPAPYPYCNPQSDCSCGPRCC